MNKITYASVQVNSGHSTHAVFIGRRSGYRKMYQVAHGSASMRRVAKLIAALG